MSCLPIILYFQAYLCSLVEILGALQRRSVYSTRMMNIWNCWNFEGRERLTIQWGRRCHRSQSKAANGHSANGDYLNMHRSDVLKKPQRAVRKSLEVQYMLSPFQFHQDSRLQWACQAARPLVLARPFSPFSTTIEKSWG